MNRETGVGSATGPAGEGGAGLVQAGEQALEIGIGLERAITGAGAFLQGLAEGWIGEAPAQCIGKGGGGAFPDPDSRDSMGKPFISAAPSKGDDGTLMGKGFHTDKAEGFVPEHGEKYPLALTIPGIKSKRGNLAEESDA